jgi:uncharacterized membrane protein YphA (DoxX/SURF4 family)
MIPAASKHIGTYPANPPPLLFALVLILVLVIVIVIVIGIGTRFTKQLLIPFN